MATPIGYDSIVQRVLEIPEIIELVLSFLERRDHISSARVCRRWSDIALDLVWRSVDDLFRLFSLLAPLITVGHGLPFDYYVRRQTGLEVSVPYPLQTFSRTLNPEDWKRFARHARRIRHLSYVDGGNGQRYLEPLVFDEVARSRTSLNILPNLNSLEWHSPRLRLSLVFMSENVKEFTVKLRHSETHPIADFFEDVAVRMPLLTYLDLSFDFPVRDIEDKLIGLLRSLTKLQKVVLPLYCISPRVMEGLSTLPSLGTVQFEFMHEQGRGDILDVQHFAPSLQEGAFPSLWDLSLSARLPDMTRFISGSYAPSNLTSLFIHVLSIVPPSTVTQFLEAVAENCKLLTNLYIDLFISSDTVYRAMSGSDERLTWDALRPVLSCSKLTVFELRWDLPLSITQDDIEEMASKWPTLEVLQLNCDPAPLTVPQSSTLTLRALLPFARHCPDLRELGLYLSATAADIDDTSISSDGAPGTPLQPFRNLSKLCIGLSSISEPGPVALFLSRLCPLGCEVVPGVSWPDGFGMPEGTENPQALEEVQRRAAEWYDHWQEVARVMPLLTRLRKEEHDRRHALEKEVEDLRVRCRLLEERAMLPSAVNANAWCNVV